MIGLSPWRLLATGLTLATATFAYTKPKGEPKGNPIAQPGMASIVPAGKGFTVVWKPTTKGTVTLVLLKGPADKAEPLYAIVEKAPNKGTYIWVPDTDLEPTDGDTGYGLQLIDDATGQYQYSTQFGISNDHYKGKSGGDASQGSSFTDDDVEEGEEEDSSPPPPPSGYGSSAGPKKEREHEPNHNERAHSGQGKDDQKPKHHAPPPMYAARGNGTAPANGTAPYPTGSGAPPKPTSSLNETTSAAPTATASSGVASSTGVMPSKATGKPEPSNAAVGLAQNLGGVVVGAAVAVLAL